MRLEIWAKSPIKEDGNRRICSVVGGKMILKPDTVHFRVNGAHISGSRKNLKLHSDGTGILEEKEFTFEFYSVS